MSNYRLSVVIPAYNESKRIEPSLKQVRSFLEAQPYSSEIIVVDDGSQDDTVEVAEEILKGGTHQVIQSEENRGKGSAVKKGMLAAKGEYVLFSDADLSTPIEEVTRFLELIQKDGYDCVIGSRALPGANLEIRQNFLRELMGKVFNRFATFFSFTNIRDSQCGFKCFKQKASQALFQRQKIEGFSFDAEILYLAQKMGYKVHEEPVTWRNSPQSRVRIFLDPLAMFYDIARIRWIHRNTH